MAILRTGPAKRQAKSPTKPTQYSVQVVPTINKPFIMPPHPLCHYTKMCRLSCVWFTTTTQTRMCVCVCTTLVPLVPPPATHPQCMLQRLPEVDKVLPDANKLVPSPQGLRQRPVRMFHTALPRTLCSTAPLPPTRSPITSRATAPLPQRACGGPRVAPARWPLKRFSRRCPRHARHARATAPPLVVRRPCRPFR